MILASKAWRWCILMLLCASWCGCSYNDTGMEEERDPNFLSGRNRKAAMNYTGAIEAFEKALETNPRSAPAHLELGLIYYQNVTTNWARAIYHFEKYLELRPQANNADAIRHCVNVCKQGLAKEVPLTTVNPQLQRELERMDKLTRENNDLHQQIESLKAQLGQHTLPASNEIAAGSSGVSNVKSQPPVEAPVNTVVPNSHPVEQAAVSPSIGHGADAYSGKTHMIRSGETPYSIARSYGVKLASLISANPGLDPKRLRPGQTLVIPAR